MAREYLRVGSAGRATEPCPQAAGQATISAAATAGSGRHAADAGRAACGSRCRGFAFRCFGWRRVWRWGVMLVAGVLLLLRILKPAEAQVMPNALWLGTEWTYEEHDGRAMRALAERLRGERDRDGVRVGELVAGGRDLRGAEYFTRVKAFATRLKEAAAGGATVRLDYGAGESGRGRLSSGRAGAAARRGGVQQPGGAGPGLRWRVSEGGAGAGRGRALRRAVAEGAAAAGRGGCRWRWRCRRTGARWRRKCRCRR